jgi:hypothetical protein
MSVYVDELHEFNNDNESTPACFRNKSSCHLYGDTEQELHELAGRIGLKRNWFQVNPTMNHYDLTSGKRRLAVRAGAIEQTFEEAVVKWEEIRTK